MIQIIIPLGETFNTFDLLLGLLITYDTLILLNIYVLNSSLVIIHPFFDLEL